jgi:Protein of unknown function (DUF1064)
LTKNAPSTGWNPRVQRQIDAVFVPKPRVDPNVLAVPYGGKKLAPDDVSPKRASKYNAVRTAYKSVQGFERVYDSKAEAEFASSLDLMIQCKGVIRWLPQIPIPLPGGVKYVADFLVFYTDGAHKYFDVKGRDTQASINKRKQVKAMFGIDVEIVGKSR